MVTAALSAEVAFGPKPPTASVATWVSAVEMVESVDL